MWRLAAFMMTVAMASPGASQPADVVAATIIDSGSTNRAGFRIVVERAGSAERTATPRKSGGASAPAESIRKKVPPALVEKLFHDIDAARPLDSLPAVHCMKSASFGSRLTLEVTGEQSPDLSCGDAGNDALRNLIRDVREIAALFAAR